MAQQIINVGSAPNDGTGDLLRVSQQKANANFTELYNNKQDTLTSTNFGTFSNSLTTDDTIPDAGTFNYTNVLGIQVKTTWANIKAKLASIFLTKVTTSGVERAYIINPDGTQSTKPTSDFGGGEENVQSDWNQINILADDFIKNKPELFSGDYNDLINTPALVTNHSELNLDDGTNPHGTTKNDVGLGNADNTSDLGKPISNATQTALNAKANISGQVFTGAVSATNLSGTNTGDNAPNSLYSGLVTNATHTGEVTGSTALTITNGAVTNAKLANVPTATLKGRMSADTGVVETLTASQARTVLNVANGANNYVHPAKHPASIITQDASNRFVTDTEKSAWNAKEPAIASGTISQYWRGDKTWQPFPAQATVDQTIIDGSTNAVSSSAVFDGLALKSNIGHTHVASQITDLSKASVGLGSVDNTSDVDKPISTATQTELDSKLDKVTTADVEKVYIKNADGTQGMKPTSELGGKRVQIISDCSSWQLNQNLFFVTTESVNGVGWNSGNTLKSSQPGATSNAISLITNEFVMPIGISAYNSNLKKLVLEARHSYYRPNDRFLIGYYQKNSAFPTTHINPTIIYDNIVPYGETRDGTYVVLNINSNILIPENAMIVYAIASNDATAAAPLNKFYCLTTQIILEEI